MADEEKSKSPNQSEEEAVGKAYDARLARRLAAYLKPYSSRVIGGIGLLILGSLFEIAGPKLTQQAVDVYIPNSEYASINFTAVLYVVLLLGNFAVSAGSTYVLQMLG